MSKEEELEMLKQQAQAMKDQMEQIMARIKDMEKGEKKDK